jgi:putative transposase
MAAVLQAYQFVLDPTPRTRGSLASHAGAALFAYNRALELVTTGLDQRATGEDVQVPWTPPELRREWNLAKQQVSPWWRENSKEAYNGGLGALARALRNWSDSRTGCVRAARSASHVARRGDTLGSPAASPLGRSRCCPTARTSSSPRIGVLKTHESTRKLARRLEQGTARILAATISRRADRWFVSFTVEVQRAIPTSNGKPSVVGVDVGVRHLAVLSTGQAVANPHALERSLRKLRRLNRELARRTPGSRRMSRTRRRTARVHAKAANLRRDALHKLTTGLATHYGTVVVEDLHVAGMLRNRRLARAISDTCEACGLRIDRDLNAARNLAKLVESVARSGWET